MGGGRGTRHTRQGEANAVPPFPCCRRACSAAACRPRPLAESVSARQRSQKGTPARVGQRRTSFSLLPSGLHCGCLPTQAFGRERVSTSALAKRHARQGWPTPYLLFLAAVGLALREQVDESYILVRRGRAALREYCAPSMHELMIRQRHSWLQDVLEQRPHRCR